MRDFSVSPLFTITIFDVKEISRCLFSLLRGTLAFPLETPATQGTARPPRPPRWRFLDNLASIDILRF